ncbi:unnamed protein product, partial [Timema podura]|nr:unnamed protein product [Timema podura]
MAELARSLHMAAATTGRVTRSASVRGRLGPVYTSVFLTCGVAAVLRDRSCVSGTIAVLWGTAGQYARKMDVRYRNVTRGLRK